MGRKIKQLDAGQRRRAAEMRERDMGWKAIGDVLGVSHHSIRACMEPGYLERHNARIATWRNGKSKREFLRQHVTPKPDIPRAVLFERERAMLAPRSVTARIMGDPPLHRSALGKRS